MPCIFVIFLSYYHYNTGVGLIIILFPSYVIILFPQKILILLIIIYNPISHLPVGHATVILWSIFFFLPVLVPYHQVVLQYAFFLSSVVVHRYKFIK